MSGYEAFSIHSRFSAKGRSRAREASRKCGNRLFWAHPGTGATSTPEQWETPLSCPLLRPGAMTPHQCFFIHTDLSLLVCPVCRVSSQRGPHQTTSL